MTSAARIQRSVIRAAQTDLLDALPGGRLSDLDELRARGVPGSRPVAPPHRAPPEYAQHLFDARDAGADDQQTCGITAEVFKESFFRDGGGRAMGMSDVENNDIDYLDLNH